MLFLWLNFLCTHLWLFLSCRTEQTSAGKPMKVPLYVQQWESLVIISCCYSLLYLFFSSSLLCYTVVAHLQCILKNQEILVLEENYDVMCYSPSVSEKSHWLVDSERQIWGWILTCLTLVITTSCCWKFPHVTFVDWRVFCCCFSFSFFF